MDQLESFVVAAVKHLSGPATHTCPAYRDAGVAVVVREVVNDGDVGYWWLVKMMADVV